MILIGVVIIILGVILIIFGIKYKDPGGTKISNVNFIGGAMLLILIGIAFLVSNKTLCEIFGILC